MIDKAFEEAIRFGEYRALLLPWVPDQLKARFVKDYRNHFEKAVD